MGVFGEKVRDLLEQRKLSQRALAEKVGVTLKTVNRWVNGHELPLYRTAQAVDEALEAEGQVTAAWTRESGRPEGPVQAASLDEVEWIREHDPDAYAELRRIAARIRGAR